jgi:hypothetical protein
MKFNLTVTVEQVTLNKKLRDICLRLTLIYMLKGTLVIESAEGIYSFSNNRIRQHITIIASIAPIIPDDHGFRFLKSTNEG